jgi:hypothetical protein
MRLVKSLLLALLVSLAFVPKPASAVSYKLGLGADYWFDQSGIFEVMLGIYQPVMHRFSVGGRFGLGLVTSPSTAAMPLDLALHFDIGRMYYLEGLVGPWIFFKGSTLRAHVGGGFGVEISKLSIGFELAYLDPNAMLGVRLSFPL